jgi:catechol 2,3-dioxygenase-like lactoylglutathione lyase family enzyme
VNAPRITLITLGVTDMKAMRAFYERLGFVASSAGNDDVTFFNVNGLVLGLFGFDALAEDANIEAGPVPAFRGMSLACNAASEAEADRIMAHAKACGARILKPAQKVFWGGYSGYFADPEGNLWEVAYNPFFPLDGAGRIVLP